MTKEDGTWRIKEFFEADHPMMLFYKHRGRNKFLYYCICGEYDSYSLFVGTWKGSPPADPVFTRMTEYRFDEDEGNDWQRMVDKLTAEAEAAGAAQWDEVTRQPWWANS